MKLKPKYYLKILALAALYVIAAKLGLSLAFSVKQITTVWPPSGLALAALILYGADLWPGILLGALVANFLTNEPITVAMGIAIGNTLEAVAGAWLLQRIIHFKPSLYRVRGVIGLVFLAAFVSTAISASIGTTSLVWGGLLARSAQPTEWLQWWFGDMAGVLLIAPALLVWHDGWRHLGRNNWPEFTALILSTLVLAVIIFFGRFSFLGSHPQVTYAIFPFIIWAAFSFKQLGITAVSIITATTAVLGTVTHHGPFSTSGSSQQQLVTLLIYIIIITTSGLFMGVAVMQRDQSEKKLQRQAEALEQGRDKILAELKAQTERQQQLESSNRRITNILSQMLDDKPRR